MQHWIIAKFLFVIFFRALFFCWHCARVGGFRLFVLALALALRIQCESLGSVYKVFNSRSCCCWRLLLCIEALQMAVGRVTCSSAAAPAAATYSRSSNSRISSLLHTFTQCKLKFCFCFFVVRSALLAATRVQLEHH